ncbi:MAG TPA: hypothetical protein PLR26_07255 [Bacilli bacterium]|nr:hypothetical protein [Bacilli bacterium]
MKKIITTILTIAIIVTLGQTRVSAESYIYNNWNSSIYSSAGLAHKDTFYGPSIKVNATDFLRFDTLEDMSIRNGKIYIIDSYAKTDNIINYSGTSGQNVRGVSRLFVLNGDFQYVDQKWEFEILPDALIKMGNFYQMSTDVSAINAFTRDLKFTKCQSDLTKTCAVLNEAQGVHASDDAIYIADTKNNRILKLNFNYQVEDVYFSPTDPTFAQNEEEAQEKPKFLPIKLTTDVANRVYVVSDSIYEGIVELSNTGVFNRFVGVNRVAANPLKTFWTKIMTEAQLAQLTLDLPPMFTNVSIDRKGFLYTTSVPSSETQVENLIKLINSSGNDVLKRNGYVPPIGDVEYLRTSPNPRSTIGPSDLRAIAANDYGIYTAVDQKRGRLFTYDNEGNLLYISGNKGVMSDALNQPSAIAYQGDNVIVLDKGSKSIMLFEPTEFGKLVNKATELHFYGRFEESSVYWEEVVKLNSNYELAYVGIGKTHLREKNYREAMENFKLGHNRDYYSKAFQEYRDELLKDNFDVIMTVAIVAIVAFGGFKYYKFIKNRKNTINEDEGVFE